MRSRRTRRSAVASVVALGFGLAVTSKLPVAATAAAEVDSGISDVGLSVTVWANPEGSQGPFCASIPAEGEGSFLGMADDPAAMAASNNPFLTTLASALETAGLFDTLNGEGPFTVLAPSNEAFADVPPSDLDAILTDTEQLASILTYHVLAGPSLSAADLVAAGRAVSVQGWELTFATDADGFVSINGGAARITCMNIATANATLHVIDSLLIPPVSQLMEVL